MSFERHISFSVADRVKPYEFELYLDSKKEGFQVKLGTNDVYSIRTKNKEDLVAITEILQRGIGEKTINSVEELTDNISSLSSVKDVKTNNIYRLGVTTLSGNSPIGSWSKYEKEIKRNIAELYWEKKVKREPENGHVRNSSLAAEETASKTSAKSALEDVRKMESSNEGISLETSGISEMPLENTHEGFINFLRFIAQYDPTIDNQDDRFVKELTLAMKTPNKENKERFLQLFESLPLGLIGSLNHVEGLKGYPEPIERNPEKRIFTETDLAELQQYMKESHFSGVVTLSDNTGRTYTLSSDNISKADTPFAMHSIGKMFTGMLAIKMIEQEIIPATALDKPVQLDSNVMDELGKFCPAVKEHLTKKGAPTFRQIMMHQGGLDDYLDKYEAAIQKAIDDPKETIPKIDSPEDFIKYAEDKTHTLKEGETHYSNLGLLLTGLSIQHHYNSKHPSDKRTYQEILEEFVVKPAGISSFSLTRPEGGRYNERHAAAAHIQGGPAGGYWITPMDLLKFGEWTAKECENKSFYQLVKEYGGEFQPERQHVKKEEDFNPEELSHAGEINSATAFLGIFLPNGINIAILTDRPFQAPILEEAIKDHILSKKN